MVSVLLAFLLACILTGLIIRYQFLHETFSSDSDFDSPQKFHNTPTPRIGGLAIYIAILCGAIIRLFFDSPSGLTALILVAIGFPAFFLGLLEDFTKKVSPRIRLLACTTSAILAIYFLGISVQSTNVGWLDILFSIPAISILLTCIMLAGLTNAYNIIDGFNGLACMVGILTLSAIGYVAFRVNDYLVLFIAVLIIGSIFGFFIWNYPRGLIFLGDSGAYLIGFLVGTLSILLINRNEEVSPWFACLINIYPAFETIFSMWRKKFIKKMSVGVPDGVHLHMLIYGRVARFIRPGDNKSNFSGNARTSPFLWLLASLSIFPAVIFWANDIALQALTVLFCASYIYIYRAIVLFKVPSWVK
jgi:UDP-N-acetylmuramyl pentapeptide phosphotransferase/UDP-N-acetylglucosamine-1-phosphate transferase